MSRAASYSSVSGQPRTFAIAASLALVSVSYVLLLSAPVVTRHLRSIASGVGAAGGLKAFEWLPLACGAGLVLGGASALVFVLTQIAREAQRRPYVCLAPLLAAFASCILIGLRAELPLRGVPSDQLTVFALALSVIGGALVPGARVPTQMLGLAFTFLPPLSLFVALWMLSGKSDPAQVIWALPAPARAYLGMLTLSSFAIAVVATLSRRAEPEPALGLPRELAARNSEREASSYVVYDLEDDLSADEARFSSRGLPGWMIVAIAAGAVVLSFMALRLFLERRAAQSFLSAKGVSAAPEKPVVESASPAPAPVIAALPARAVEPAPAAAEPSDDATRVIPAAPALDGAPSTARQLRDAPPEVAPEQPQRAETAKASFAPRASRQASAVSAAARQAARLRLARAHHKPLRATRAARLEKPIVAATHEPAQRTLKATEAQPESAQPKALPPKAPKSVAELAVQAAALAKPAAASAKPAVNDGLDELMDNVLKPDKGSKKQQASDDPIYGL